MSTLERTPDGPRDLDPWRARDAAKKDLLATSLTARERLRAYPLLWAVPLWLTVVALLAVLAGPDGWSGDAPSALALLALWMGMFTPLLGMVLAGLGEDGLSNRRAQTVLRRAARQRQVSWAVADGEHVRVYALAVERRPGRPSRVEVTGAREFHAERDADLAHAYRAELDRAARPDPAALALARVLNAP